jgi:hypothetical protein
MLRERDSLQEALGAFLGAVVKGAVPAAGEFLIEFEQPDGVWSLGTGGSRWALVDGDHAVLQDKDDESALERFGVAIGRHVVGVQPGRDESGRDVLKIELGEGLSFFIVGSSEDAADLPVFELSSPQHRVVSLYSDGSVEDFPSDVPIRELVANGRLHHWPSDAD